MSAAREFLAHIRPFQNKYALQTKRVDMFSAREWVTVNKRLHAKTIERALYARADIAWFSAFNTHALCLDIDAHDIDADAFTLTETLRERYLEAVRLVGHTPSLLYQSARGLHAYWLLSSPVPDKMLLLSMYDKRAELQRIHAEIRGTSNHALRIPRYDKQLDPTTLSPIPLSFDALKFRPYELLTETPATLRMSFKQRQTIVRSVRVQRQLEELESAYTFAAHASNEAFKRLVAAYFARGLPQSEAVERLKCKLFADGYIGELSNTHRLAQRVASSYKSLKRQPYTPDIASTLTFADVELIDTLTAKHPFARQRTSAVRRFLEHLFHWCSWHDAIWTHSQQDVTLMSFLYAGYRTQRRLGRYPLPWAVMEKWNFRAYEIVQWLKREHIIQEPRENPNDPASPRKPTRYYFVSESVPLTTTRRKNPGYLTTCKFYEVSRLVEVHKDTSLELLLRLAEDNTQSELARLLGVSQSSVSRFLAGKQAIPGRLRQIMQEVQVIKYNIPAPDCAKS